MFAKTTEAGLQWAKSAQTVVTPPRSLLAHACAIRSTYSDGGYLVRTLLERCATIAKTRFSQEA